MKIAEVRRYALSLPDVGEAPHFNFSSFRVRGKIFVTVPPGDEIIHVFVAEPEREIALALHPEFLEKLTWGGKVVGLRVSLAGARAAAVKLIMRQAWQRKAPKTLAATLTER